MLWSVLVPGNDKVRSVCVFPYFQDGASGFAYRFYQQELPVFDDTPAGIGENLPRLSIRCLEYILGLGGIESKWMQNFKQQGFRRRFLQQGADLYPLVCHYPLLGFFYTFIIYNGGIIQVSGRFKNTFFYCGIYFLREGRSYMTEDEHKKILCNMKDYAICVVKLVWEKADED